jgi:hypothetical protein
MTAWKAGQRLFAEMERIADNIANSVKDIVRWGDSDGRHTERIRHALTARQKSRRPRAIEHFFDTVNYPSGAARVHTAKQ